MMTAMPLSHVLLALAVAVLWGFNFVVMKHVVSEAPPLAVTGVRFLLAVLPLIFFLPRPSVTNAGLFGFGIAFGVVKFGLLFTAFKLGMPAGLGSLVLQMQAVFTILLAGLVLGERPLALQWAGIVVAVLGAAVIVAGGTSAAPLVAVVLTLAAAFAWGIANIIVKRERRFEPVAFAVWSSLLPGLVMTAASLVVEGPAAVGAALKGLSPLGMAAFAYLAWPVSILSGAMWGFLMMRHSAAAVAPFALLVPVIGLISSHLVYGETLTRATLVGGGLIIAGLALNTAAMRFADPKGA